MARSHDWDISGITIRELLPNEDALASDDQYTMYHPSEVELASTTKLILEDVHKLNPTRVVFDSLSELRLVAGNPLRYRRQILALKQFFAGRNCTVIVLDDMTATEQDLHVQSIAHGVILLQHLSPEYGAERRRLRVIKYRGTSFRGGFHDYLITKGGLQVFPRLVAAEHRGRGSCNKLASEHPGAGRPAGRRDRGRHQHADCRRRRHRQVDHRRAVLGRGRGARRQVGRVHVRREPAIRCSHGAAASASTSSSTSKRG